MIMALAMFVAVAGVAFVGWLLARAAVEEEHVSTRWLDAHVRDRRDDV